MSAVKTVMFLLGAAFIIWLLVQNWSVIVEYSQSIHVGWMLFALLVGGLSNFLLAVFFSNILKKHSTQSYLVKDGIRAYINSQPVKYIPGKIWQFLFQSFYVSESHNKTRVFLVNIEFMLVLVAFVGGLSGCLLFYARDSFLFILSFISLILVGAGYTFVSLRMSADIKTSWQLTLLALVASAGYLTAIYFYFYAWDLSIAAGMTELVGLSGISWAAGILSFVFPAGLGVKEWVFIYLPSIINIDINYSLLVSYILFMRIWQIIYELVSVLVYRLFR
ncbi:hypothetical protein [Pleionea sp. CnH1-48]|uniref:hypothetical protein n=1 Tax=Pleionea sp. CnH1-48 TaxID=2954494 RepID=UPI002097988C|nr:hypothetical protein [Pleionea sp. CnH1-48]MCO7223975.1 hypothetical protein [Pleionea sp. CnH1-48]